jgi:hypothetical protein
MKSQEGDMTGRGIKLKLDCKRGLRIVFAVRRSLLFLQIRIPKSEIQRGLRA